jgi:pimeloyl-ACP methyl ester carboxylesterase
MAKDAVTFIRALGFDQVDLHGFSMGGMIAQLIAGDEPALVRKLILTGTGTGPAGGKRSSAEKAVGVHQSAERPAPVAGYSAAGRCEVVPRRVV